MPVLQNARHEQFCHLLVQGKGTLKAYMEAGFAKSSKSAKTLAEKPDIVARIAEIREEVGRQLQLNTGLTVERVAKELEKLGFANMLDYVKIDEDGQPELDFSELNRDKAAAIGEITTDVITNPRTGEVTKRTKFKLLDKKGALVDLGRYLGMWVDRKELKVGGVMFHISADDASL